MFRMFTMKALLLTEWRRFSLKCIKGKPECLELNKLKSVMQGVLRIEENEGYYSLYRFTKEQVERISARVGTTRMFCTASVRMEFKTKGGKVSFDYRITLGTQREYYSFDLLIDGLYVYNKAENKYETGNFSYDIPYSEELKTVTIYFPTTVRAEIANLILPEDMIPVKRDKKILLLGDSGLQGYYPNHFQNTYANILADKFNAEGINQSIGGDCFNAENLERLDFDPEFIIVCYGVNDWYSGRFKNGEAAELYLQTLIELYKNIPVFLLIPNHSVLEKKDEIEHKDLLYKEETQKRQPLSRVREILLALCEKYNITPVNPKEFAPEYSECYYEDNVHLTDLGNVLYADTLIKELEKYI